MEDPKIVTYPIPANDNGGLLHIYGNAHSSNVILFCGGYPDDHKPFTPLARLLALESKCFVGITCFPGFELGHFDNIRFNGYKRTGYSFDEVCACIREAVSLLFFEWNKNSSQQLTFDEVDDRAIDSRNVGVKFTIVLHDWAVIPGLMYVNRSIGEQYSLHVPNKIVLLDVLTAPHKHYQDVPLQVSVPYSLKPSTFELAVCFSYRFALASSFAVLCYVSEILGLINLVVSFGIVMLLRLNPTRALDNLLIEERRMSASSQLSFYRHLVYMCYPYYYMFRCFIRGTGFEDISIPLDLKSTPILYIYGTNKNVMFHDWRSLAILEREEREGRSECRVVRVEDAGHWMYVQKLDVCLNEIKSFIEGDGSDKDVNQSNQ
ncbi:hypothetical protein HJC23_011211 [Cyclotella cryptica]|uniref:Uncharacterized protein n=1 Tax=Cyclotella cryptica TaxID=29204 RepID=A0ABD3PXG5_9STRA|eukprot:CCRYP_011026-RA/>CCRYP_011026-RA protein AED:0.32 eAED:0.32 QI:122/1/1/1/0/0/2/880/375